MAYKKKMYRFRDSNEYEYTYAGKYGAKGEKRAPKKKATKAQIKRQNQWIRENYIRRILLLNFVQGDLWICIKYPKNYRPPLEQIIKDINRLITNVRNAYKKHNTPFKWVIRFEIGEKGGIHIHIAANRIPGHETHLMIDEKWRYILRKQGIEDEKASGQVDYRNMYEAGGFKALAEYIAKVPLEDSEEYEQLSLFAPVQQKKLLKVSTSRNLVRPEPEVKECKKWTMRRLVDEGPEPTPGYYIDLDSVVCGINPYTGMSYLRYTEYRIRGKTERGQP